MTDPPSEPRRGRGRLGCLNCRRRKKKCDEKKPVCTKCASRGESCQWDSGFVFRLSGIDAQHPSMIQSNRLGAPRFNKNDIMNVSFNSDTHESSHAGQLNPDTTKQDDPTRRLVGSGLEESPVNANIGRSLSGDDLVVDDTSIEDNPPSTLQEKHNHHSPLAACETVSVFSENANNDFQQSQLQRGLSSDRSAPPAVNHDTSTAVESMELCSIDSFTNSTGRSDGLSADYSVPKELDVASVELEALDYLTYQPNHLLFPASVVQPSEVPAWDPTENPDLWSPPVVESPDIYMYYPNATYKNLHSTLYHHMVETARNSALTRQNSPSRVLEEAAVTNDNVPHYPEFNGLDTQRQEPGLDTTLSSLPKLSRRRQSELWRNYLDEIASWLDMFDNERHFQLQLPQLAMSANHLHYSVLALSARQIERKDPEGPYIESLGLYQEAIQLILLELHTLDTAVIASCVLLCVLEMMSSSPRAWSRHLNGCAMLLEAAGVNGVVGGMRQSLFWCFARMDVWGGFLGDTLTMIPTSRWFVPRRTMHDAISHFKDESGCDSYANYTVFLCASVVNVVSNGIKSTSEPTYSARWKALFELLEDWYARRPKDMRPILSLPSLPEEQDHPFPIVLYSNSPAINGNQLYHAASLLMLQEKPKHVRLLKGGKSILWHARQICGIAASNHSHGPWINALQPLWIAGKIMSHATEHKAILEILTKIERETGWATAWRAQDLREYWGDADF